MRYSKPATFMNYTQISTHKKRESCDPRFNLFISIRAASLINSSSNI